jgi:hypothetical protein
VTDQISDDFDLVDVSVRDYTFVYRSSIAIINSRLSSQSGHKIISEVRLIRDPFNVDA